MTPRRQVGVVLVILALVGLADFTQRVFVGRDERLGDAAAVPARPIPPPRDAAAIRADFGRWMPGLGGAPGVQGAPASWTLRLAGTFVEQRAQFAVIVATPQGSGSAPQTHRLRVGESLHGETLRQIRPGAVTLESPAGTRELTVFPRRAAGGS